MILHAPIDGTPALPDTADRRAAPRPVWRFRVAAVCLVLTALAFLQDPGVTAADTKLDLTQNPWGFMARALNLWDERGFFGQLQNQAYGYLWPMGPFFGVGDLLGIDPWIVQRLWWSVILCGAFVGMVWLLRLLGVTNQWARLLGALTFALAPRIITELGPTSVEVWPMALAPWLLIPLVLGSLTGSVRRCAAASGAVFFCAGGVNAVATLAILPLGVLWLLTREPGPRRRRLAGWWAASIALASVWWLVPLLILGRYSPPFLDWIESAAVTTSQADPTSAVRGTTQWVAYLVGARGPLWQAGWSLLAQPWIVAATGLLSAAGLAGLALRKVRERTFLLLCFLSGLALTTLGHVGVPEGAGATWIRALLDGPLAPLRNTHKFAVLIAVPLAVGVGVLIQRLLAERRAPALKRAVAWTGLAVIAISLIASSAPLLRGEITRGRVYLEIPQYWREAAMWLDENADEGRALLTPGASFGEYLWGRTQDEPLQALTARASWAVRDAVPLSSAGNIRFLDEIESRLEAGEGSPGFASALNRAGVRWLVVRNDLDPLMTGAPPLILVHQAIDQSPGIERVATFGPVLPPYRGEGLVLNDGLERAAPPIEIYRVGPEDLPPPSAQVAAIDRLRTLTGGPEALVGLADARLIDEAGPGTDPLVISSDLPADVGGSGVAGIATDTYRRSEARFGSMRDQYSATYLADQPWALPRRVHDYELAPPVVTSVADLVGVESITASSSGSDPTASLNRSPANQPWSALDGDPDTAWRPGSPGDEAWWQVNFDQPRSLGSVPITLASGTGPRAEVTVTTSGGSRAAPIVDGAIELGGVTTDFLRIGSAGTSFGLAQVEVPGLSVARPIVAPASPADGGILLEARRGQRSGCGALAEAVVCSPLLPRVGEEQAGIDRVITVAKGATYSVSMRVRPRPSDALNSLLDSGTDGTRIVASSEATQDPAGRAAAAFDLNDATTWIASPLDAVPSLTLEFGSEATVSGLQLSLSPFAAASAPLKIEVSTDQWTSEFFLGKDGSASWEPTRTATLRIRIPVAYPVRSVIAGRTGSRLLPVGVTELRVRGTALPAAGLAQTADVVSPCGFGPRLTVAGGASRATEVRSTVAEVTRGQLATAVGCDGELTLEPGEHRLVARSTAEWTIDAVVLTPTGPARSTTPPLTEVSVRGTGDDRVLSAGPYDADRVLSLTENFNEGLQATQDGQALQSLRIDGWRQGFILPAGGSGEVEIRFGPNRAYQAGLLIGLGCIVVLVALLVLPDRRRRLPSLGDRPLVPLVWVTAVVSALLIGGVGGLIVAIAAFAAARRFSKAEWVVALAVGVGVLTQVIVPWPARASAGSAVDLLLTLPIAAAVGALASSLTRVPGGNGDSTTGTGARSQTS